MEKGTIVKVVDGSYSAIIEGNEIKMPGNICQGQQYIILATDCVLPATSSKRETNNVIMKDLDSNAILFIQKRFLRPIHQCNICPRCGKAI